MYAFRFEKVHVSMIANQQTSIASHSSRGRFTKNFIRAPQRILRSLGRLFGGTYQWEKRAERELSSWLTAERSAELDALEGTSNLKECQLLAWLSSVAPAGGCVVEIGAWKGRSTAWLVEGAQQQTPPLDVFSIDPHERQTWESFQKTATDQNLFRRGLTVLRAYSHDVGANWTAPISLLWIDGCHEFKEVRQDILDFTPHVVPRGWVVFDDAAGGHFPGVERAIAEEMPHRKGFQHITTLRHLQIFRKG